MTVSHDDPNESLRLWERHIHAFVTLCPGDAPETGPLAGLRVGVKDIIDVSGVPTLNGSETCKDALPVSEDATVVATLRDAGAHIVGKTTTTEFAFTDPTACRNPHDLRRSPGGSSSGSGAAVAAAVLDIAFGTQTAGSLIRPAAYCGVVGFKPTYGVLPMQGVTPLAPSFDTVGIIARSLGLARRAFGDFASPDDAGQDQMPLRVVTGLWQTGAKLDGAQMSGLRGAAHAVSALGLDIATMPLMADVDPIVAAHRTVMNYEAFAGHGAMLSDARADVLQPKFKAGLEAGSATSPDQAAEASAFLTGAREAFWAAHVDTDIVLTLPVPEGAPLIDGTTGFQDWLTPWTVFGGPLVCLPWGLDNLGRPISIMLAARPGHDHTLLKMAARLESNSPDIPRPVLPKP